MYKKIKRLIARTKTGIKTLVREERGDFGIGQIAAIVAGIVIIGVIIGIVTGFMDQWIEEVWGWISDLFDAAR